MPGRSFRIAQIAGIPVGVSPLWLIVVALITWSLGAGYYPDQVPGITSAAAYGLGLASALLLFASILAHEFGHALLARRRGVQVDEIDLWLLGGVARMSGQPRTAEDERQFALAGPAVTAVIAALFGAVALALPASAPTAVRAVVDYQMQINLLILGFNLVPAFPLDGGRVARALIWRRTGDMPAATNTAARFGRAFGYLLVVFGVLLALEGAAGGLWFALIGVFLVAAAGAERMEEQLVASFTGVRAEELMSSPAISIPSDTMLAEAQEYYSRYRFTAFPVTDATGRAVGMLSIDHLRRTPPARWPAIRAGERAERDPALLTQGDEDVAHLLAQPAFRRFGRAAVVDRDGRPVGVVSLTDIERALRASRLQTGSHGGTGLVAR
ncbi:MAG TPA: site-2 protease family protein [Solirubrobacteraceae bacterium]|nr:site-2 protease family protein [Solirubrobacteraceae bacterium]